MFLYDNQRWPLVVIHFQESDWDLDDFESFLLSLQLMLKKTIDEGTRIKLLVLSKIGVSRPPLPLIVRLVQQLIVLRPFLEQGLDRTCIYQETEEMSGFTNFVLNQYTPVRPLAVFSNIRRMLCLDGGCHLTRIVIKIRQYCGKNKSKQN